MSVVPHISVMLPEVLSALQPRDGEIYVDGTFGAGGYSRALLNAAECRVYAIDRDPEVRRFAEVLEKEFAGRFVLLAGNFADMVELLASEGVERVDGVVLDVGVSSMQIDTAERGFSFRNDGPLDMRMSQDGMSAADLVNEADETELADILYHYGEERQSRRIAKAIVEARAIAPITRTSQLAEIVRRVLGRGKDGIDPATRTFQALRIKVNHELEELERALAAAESLLVSGGRLVVVAFHSLEDRIVKQFLTLRSSATSGVSRHLPPSLEAGAAPLPSFFLRPRGAVKVGADEASNNSRARSAKLRAAVRTDNPVWREARS